VLGVGYVNSLNSVHCQLISYLIQVKWAGRFGSAQFLPSLVMCISLNEFSI